jgi:hypothetical protein
MEPTPLSEQSSHRNALLAWLLRTADLMKANGPTAILMARRAGGVWEQAGLTINHQDGVVLAKIGSAQAQPIGAITPTEYHMSDAGRILWSYEWAVAVGNSIPGAFKTAIVRPITPEATLAAPMTPREREVIGMRLAEIKEEAAWLTAARATGESSVCPAEMTQAQKVAEHAERLLDTIKLASISSPKLDARLRMLGEELPELKPDFSGITLETLTDVVLRFLEESVQQETTPATRPVWTIEALAIEPAELKALVIARLARITQNAISEAEQGDSASMLLDAVTAFPHLRPTLAAFEASADFIGARDALVKALNEPM